MDNCPICEDIAGFHFEEIHALNKIPEDLLLPIIEVPPSCRACGEPLDGPGLYGCRYPNHKEV